MNEVESELYVLCDGKFAKLYSAEEVIKALEKRIDKADRLLKQLHYLFDDEDRMHNQIEEIQKVLKGQEI